MKKSISKKSTPISGSFIQNWLYSNREESYLDNELELLKSIGCEYIIMGDTAFIEKGKWKICYPSKLPLLNDAEYTKDDIITILKKCQLHGLKLFLGTGFDPEWWNIDPLTKQKEKWFLDYTDTIIDISRELYNMYHGSFPETFYGWYFVPEMWNFASQNDTNQCDRICNLLSKGFTKLIDAFNTIDSSMPILFSPFVNIKDHGTLEGFTYFWTKFLSDTPFRNIDILCPQDSVGSGGNNLENLDKWTSAYKNAVDNSGHGMHFFSNCENFVQPEDKFIKSDGINRWGIAPVNRYIKQIEITSKYAERIFSFSYSHYYSPFITQYYYHKLFTNYYKDGKLSAEAPLQQESLKFRYSYVNNMLTVSWDDIATKNGINRIDIYKNDSFFDFRVASTFSDEKKNIIPTSFSDSSFSSGDQYSLVFHDCIGNKSKPFPIVPII